MRKSSRSCRAVLVSCCLPQRRAQHPSQQPHWNEKHPHTLCHYGVAGFLTLLVCITLFIYIYTTRNWSGNSCSASEGHVLCVKGNKQAGSQNQKGILPSICIHLACHLLRNPPSAFASCNPFMSETDLGWKFHPLGIYLPLRDHLNSAGRLGTLHCPAILVPIMVS